jgi:hypothetical protein
MDLITELQTKWNIDIYIIAIVMLSGFFQEKYMCILKWSKDARLDAALKTLAVSLLVSSLYILITYRDAKRGSQDGKVFLPWGKYLITYFATTSLYDLAVRPFRKFLKKKFGDDDEPIKPTQDDTQKD